VPGITIIGPVYPYRAGIAYCTTRLAGELGAAVVSFKRQYPRFLYPGTSDVDESLRGRTPPGTRFLLDILNPLTWIATAVKLRREKPDAVVIVWWIWVWALPYLTLLALLPKSTRVVLQCHNIGDKEPSWWKSWLTNRVLRLGHALVVHARSEFEDARARAPRQNVTQAFLPVHEMGSSAIPSRDEAKRRLGITGDTALAFGHVRPYKGVDIALNAWRMLGVPVTLVVAGEAWWKSADEYRALAAGLGNVRLDLRFIPDSEIATYFAAADVVLAPYRTEAQSGVALTAFHFGRPVIASTVGGLPEIIRDGENGLLIPPENPRALADAVTRFFTSLDRNAMERAAAESARRYSWAEYASVLRRLLHEQ
jgi:glycosyltransferase involved in cell wall biosynthesis